MSTTAANGSLIERMGDRLADVVENWMPNPFLFAIILTYIAYIAALIVEGTGPFETVLFWFDGFWLFLQFAMQMTLILMTGFVVAYHPKVNAILRRLTRLPNDGKQAAVLVGFAAMSLAWVHWGLSGSAPLLIATEGNEFIELGVLDGVVPASATIFSTYALALTVTSIALRASSSTRSRRRATARAVSPNTSTKSRCSTRRRTAATTRAAATKRSRTPFRRSGSTTAGCSAA